MRAAQSCLSVVMNSLPLAMFRSCRFQSASQDALRSPALGVPNRTTFFV